MRKNQIQNIPDFYKNYVAVVEDLPLLELLESNKNAVLKAFGSFSEEKGNYKYAADKWSVKDLFQHIIDAERVFMYRALRFARNDKTVLPGFEQDDFVTFAQADKRTLASLVEEFKTVREASISLFRSLEEEALLREGNANKNPMSALALGFFIAGHALHHTKILEERYK
ncbi:MAG: DinB family protein [Cytophagales bacterium]|nr:MAG: DinB family protein [Cytophagales bacterium]